MVWFEPSQSPSLMQLLSHSPTSRMRERMGRVKARKLVDWGLISKNCACRQSKTKNYLTASHRQAGVQSFPGEQSPSCLTITNTVTPNIPPFFFFFFSHILSMMSNSLEYLWSVSLGHLSWLCLLPVSQEPPTSLPTWQYDRQKRLQVCVNPAQQ